MTDAGSVDFNNLVEALRALVTRSDRETGLQLTSGDVEVLAAAARALERVPDALRASMDTAFQLGREHGRKEELLARLEREITRESERLAREAWGKRVPVRPVRHS